MKNTELIILAAGKGTRMDTDLPKCLVEVKGIPIIHRLLSNVEKAFIHKPLVVVGHKAEQVEKALGNRTRFVRQYEQKGTAHATKTALTAILPDTKYVVVLYADHPFVSRDTVEKLVAGLSTNTIMSGITDVGDFNGWKSLFNHWGRVIYSKDGGIDKIIEYKDADEATRSISVVTPAFYAFDVKWLKGAIEKVKAINANKEYYLHDVVPFAREENLKVGKIMLDPLEAIGLNSKPEIEYVESLL